jgi:hypothetical protein
VAARMGWVAQKVALGLTTDPTLGFAPVSVSWPVGTIEAAEALDEIGFPLDGPMRAAEAALKEAGKGKRAKVVREALSTAGRCGTHPGTRTIVLTRDAPRDAPAKNPITKGRTHPRTHRDAPPPGKRDAPRVPLGTRCGPAPSTTTTWSAPASSASPCSAGAGATRERQARPRR